MTRTREKWIEICKGIKAGFVPSTGRASIYDSGVDYVAKILVPSGALGSVARVVDVGCGNGRLAMGLVSCGDLDVEYHGVDVVKESITFCNGAFQGFPNFHFTHVDVRNSRYNRRGRLRGEVMTLPISAGWATLVIASSLFTHIADVTVVRRYLSEMRRVVKPGGKLLTTWFRSPPNEVGSDEARVVYSQGEIKKLLMPDEIVWQRGGKTREHHDQWMILTAVKC